MNQKIRQQESASKSYHNEKDCGNLAEMDKAVLNLIAEGKALSANYITKYFKGIYEQSSITGAINRIRYDEHLIKGRKLELPNQRKQLYYSIRKENEPPDVRKKLPIELENEFFKAENQRLLEHATSLFNKLLKAELEIKNLKATNEMLKNNFILNK